MKKTENTPQRFYKDQFSLPQMAAFALTANWAEHQHETLLKTQPFQKLFIHRMNLSATDPIFRFKGGLLQTLRNYCSHWRHDPPRALVESEQEKWNHLVRCALDELRQRGQQAERDQPNASYDFEAADLFKFEAKPLTDHGQPELALMLAPFLTKGQASYLCAKIWFGPDARIEQDGKKTDTPKTALKKDIIRLLAQPDNVILRLNNPGYEPWLSPAHEQAFAIWDLLYQQHKAGKDTEPLADRYIMRQLVLFIENDDLLPGWQFQRIRTDWDEEGKPVQVKVFAREPDWPLRIIHNTIQAQGPDNVSITLGLHPLLWLVMAVLYAKPKPDPAGMASWLASWAAENKDHPKQVSPARDEKPLPDRLASRLDWLIKDLEKTPPGLQAKIRFICQQINRVWMSKNEKALHIDEYKRLEEKVRYYRKQELRGWLEESGLLDETGIGLGRGDEKSLKQLVKDEQLDSLFKSLQKARVDWAKGCKERLHKLAGEEQQELARQIGLRPAQSSKLPPTMPVGLPDRAVRDKFLKDAKNATSLASMLRQPIAPWAYPIGKLGEKTKKQRHHLVCRQILLNMAWQALKELTEKGKFSKQDEFPKPADLPITLDTGNHQISLKFGLAWRSMAKKDKGYYKKLLTAYLPEQKGVVPLLRVEEETTGQSVESLETVARSERFLFLQALLKWERDFIESPNSKIAPNEQGYIPFDKISSAAGLDGEITKFRNAALHNSFVGQPFATCPPPIKPLYEALAKRQQEKRQRQKQEGQKRHFTKEKQR